MKKHHGLFLALGLMALLGLAAPEARAENVTLNLSWSGGSLSIDFTSPFAQAGGSPDSVTVDTTTLNTFLAANGSNLMFTALEADSNSPGDPVKGAILRETGNVLISGAGGDNSISIVASQNSFTTPTGSGSLLQAAGANFSSTTTSTQTSTATLNGTTLSSTFTGPGGFVDHSSPASASGTYTLTTTTDITLSGTAMTTSDQWSNKVTFFAIPEPASLVMMLTGMPLPLVILGMLRRRRAAA